MSESGGGTDVLGMATTALITAGDDDNFVMNGSKMWITNGTLTGNDTGDIFLVYAKTGPRKGGADLTSFIGTFSQILCFYSISESNHTLSESDHIDCAPS